MGNEVSSDSDDSTVDVKHRVFRKFVTYKPWVLDVDFTTLFRLTKSQDYTKSEDSRELIIAFVYDRERCQREEDDPHLAIVYFYPSWVSGEQQLLLCGQLIGVTHFFESTFATPSILSLQSGKFSMKFFGRYILCVGTDRNIPDSVLLARTNVLHLVLQLYHGDFEMYINSNSTTRFELHEKLSQVFEVYLPIMIYAGNIFNNLPLLGLPKSGSTVFLEASQMLQFFRNRSGALGGMILYKNKVVVSQLGGELTKALIASDPYRIKVPAAPVTAPYRIPFRVQLLKVFLTSKQYNLLKERKTEISSALNNIPFWNVDPSVQCDVPPAPGSVLMKRDKSRIFPVLEEEDDAGGGGSGDQSVHINGESESASPSSSKLKPKVVPDIVKDAMHARWISRLQTNTPASYIIPDRSYKLFKFSTTESIPNNTYRRGVLPIRYYSLGLPPVKEEWCNDVPFEDDSFKSTHMYYNTITDPINPLFRSNGMPASRLLYHERLEDHYLDIKAEYSKENDQCMVSASDMINNRGQGVPLTPLMAKLTMLANERQTPAATPSTSRQFPTVTLPSTSKKYSAVDSIPSTSSQKTLPQIEKNDKFDSNEQKPELVESVLFIFGINSTTIMFLMEPSSAQDPTIIHNLWDSCTNTLEQLETSLKNVMEHCSNTGMSAADSYSYLAVDPDWGTTQRGGTWTAPQLELLTTLHDDLSKKPHLTEFTVKCEESIVYGYQLGEKKVFYQQSSSSSSSGGLPTPADLMAFAHLKAKRVLERDHNVILL